MAGACILLIVPPVEFCPGPGGFVKKLSESAFAERSGSFEERKSMASLPSYVAAAQPVPKDKRAPWYKTTAQTYAGIMLWFVFWMSVPEQRRPGSSRHFGPGHRPGNSWRGNRRSDLPFPLLSCAGIDGDEDRPAAGGCRHFHVRRARRLSHARLPDGRVAVRLVGGQCLFFLRASCRVLSEKKRCRPCT